jgi:hypothetical protein
MSTQNVSAGHVAQGAAPARGGALRRLTTETKNALKTTEFWAMVVVIAGILICAAAIKGGDNTTDEFIARQAWLYVSIVAGAYMISRGLAKSGSREPYNDDNGGDWDGNRR